MSLLNITCPRCGYSKSIEQQQIPPAANIQCRGTKRRRWEMLRKEAKN